MIYLLIALIPVAFILGAFITIKAIQIGLRWQMQAEKKEQPTISSPLQPIADILNEKKVENLSADILSEWRGV
jgi:hypothetical protein